MIRGILKKLFEQVVPDPERTARVAKIKAQAELRRRRRNSNRLLTWTSLRST